MRVKSRLAVRFAALFLVVAAAAPVAAQQKTVSIGTHPPGSSIYAVGSGLSKIVSEAGPFQMLPQPYTGTSTFIPLLDRAQIEFGLASAVDLGLAHRGPKLQIGGRNPLQHAQNIRVVMRGFPFVLGLLVKKDSPIKTMQDVRGRRVTGEYPAAFGAWVVIHAGLASAGLSWNDVRVVPVPGVNEGVDAVVRGHADVSQHSLNSAKVKEADAAVGIRQLSIDCSPEGEARLRAAVPGVYPRMVKGGTATGVAEDTCFVAYDYYLTTGTDVPAPIVRGVLSAIWDNVDKLPPLHPLFREWTRARSVDATMTIPYHDAAVSFYKEKGVWTPQADAAQQKVLKP